MLKLIGCYIVAGAATTIGGFLGMKIIDEVTDPYKRANRRHKVKIIKTNFRR